MSLRSGLRTSCRALALRSRPAINKPEPFLVSFAQRRRFADDVTKGAGSNSTPSGRSRDSWEASPSSGKKAAEADEYDLQLDDLEAALRSVTVEGAKATENLEGALTPEQQETLYNEGVIPPLASGNPAVDQLQEMVGGVEVVKAGHKFPLPVLPLPEGSHLKRRYHPVLDQFTKTLMRDGKLSAAQRHMALLLNFLRSSPPPIISPKYPLLPGAPPPAHLPLNPVLYLTIAIDSVSPLVNVRHLKGLGGGGTSLEVPAPLAVRQRRRMAIKWLLDVVEKKPSRGSGRAQLAHRLSEEIVAIVEGRSSLWDRRDQVHKQSTAARANLFSPKLKSKSKSF